MYKLLMTILIFAAAKTIIAYLIARLKNSKKRPISAEELIKFKGITKDQYEKLVAPIMWDSESYYEQLKFNLHYNIKDKINDNTNNTFKKPKVMSIDDYYKQIEEEYKSLKESFRDKYSNIS